MGIEKIISAQRIYLDTNIFIYLLEEYPEYIPVLTELFTIIDIGKLQAVTSELTVAETLVKPMKDNNIDLQQTYIELLQTTSMLNVVPINHEILITAAKLRAKNNKIKLPDAIHAATAFTCQCQTFLTNDKCLKNIPNINVVLLSELAALLASKN